MFKKTKTIDGIVSTFTSMIQDLRDIEQKELANKDNFELQAAINKEHAEDAAEEAERASQIRQRIEQIVG